MVNKVPAVHIDQLPPELSATLQRATRRIKSILLLRGLLAVTATTLIALLAIIAIDASFVLYSQILRLGLSLIGLSAVVWVAMSQLVRPLLQPYSPAKIATLIEQRHPELEERLSTVVELLAMPETRERGSAQLVSLITDAAEADARTVSPKREFTGRTIKPKLVVAGIATSIVILLFAVWPSQLSLLCLRALAPFAALDNLFASQLHVKPGSVTMLVGDPLEVDASIKNVLLGQAYLRKKPLDSFWARETPERMRLLPSQEASSSNERLFRQLFPAVGASFQYRVTCGYALTRYYTVTAVDRPVATIRRVLYSYPQYTGKPERVQTNEFGEIAGVIGTQIKIDAHINRPSDLTGTFIMPPTDSAITPSQQGRLRKQFLLNKDSGPHWGIVLMDQYGFTNLPAFYPLRAIVDRPPTIIFTQPTKHTVRIAKRGLLSLAYQITDDFGITNATLNIASNDQAFSEYLPLRNVQPVDAETWKGLQTVDLKDEKWASSRKIRLQLTVSDKRTDPFGGPQVAKSHTLTIEFDDGARTLESQNYKEQTEKIKQSIQDLTEQLRKDERQAEELRNKLDNKQKLEPQDQQKLDAIRNDLAEAEQKVEDAIAENKDSALKPLADKLDSLNKKQISEARKTAEQAQQAAQQQQSPQIRSLEKKLEDAVKTAEEMKREAEAFAQKLDKLAAIDELATREEALAKDAPKTDTPSKMNDWKQNQDDIRNRFNQERSQLPEAQPTDKNKAKEKTREAQTQKLARARLEKARDSLKALAEEAQQQSENQEALAEAQKERADQYENKREKPDANAMRAENRESIQQQREVAKTAQTMEHKTESLKQELQRLNPPGELMNPVQQAQNELNQAQQRGQEAVHNLEQQPNNPRDPVWKQEDAHRSLEQSAAALEQAARQASQLMEKMDAEAAAQERSDAVAKAQPQAGNPETSMNEASRDAEQARQSKEQENRAQQNPDEKQPAHSSEAGMKAAEEHATDAAEQMRQMVDQVAAQLNVPTAFLPSRAAERPELKLGMGQHPIDQMQPTPAPYNPSAQLPEALRGKLPDTEWFKLKGEAKSQAMDDALRRISPEYRDLVRLYFQELSKETRK
jgi:hypothetical protein